MDDLLPELAGWNSGRGIGPLDWLYVAGLKSDLVVACSSLFWPKFVLHDDLVLREGFDEGNLRDWQKVEGSTRAMVEAAVNTLHIDDLFSGEPWSELLEQRCVHVGRTIGEIHRLKLASDFPDRRFEVEVFDGSQEGGDISLSFWQI